MSDICTISGGRYDNYNRFSPQDELKLDDYKESIFQRQSEFTTADKFDPKKFKKFLKSEGEGTWNSFAHVINAAGINPEAEDAIKQLDDKYIKLNEKNLSSCSDRNACELRYLSDKYSKMLYHSFAQRIVAASYMKLKTSPTLEVFAQQDKALAEKGFSREEFCAASAIIFPIVNPPQSQSHKASESCAAYDIYNRLTPADNLKLDDLTAGLLAQKIEYISDGKFDKKKIQDLFGAIGNTVLAKIEEAVGGELLPADDSIKIFSQILYINLVSYVVRHRLISEGKELPPDNKFLESEAYLETFSAGLSQGDFCKAFDALRSLAMKF